MLQARLVEQERGQNSKASCFRVPLAETVLASDVAAPLVVSQGQRRALPKQLSRADPVQQDSLMETAVSSAKA